MKNETLGAHLRNLLTPYKNLLQLMKDVAGEETIRKYNLDNLDELIAFSNSGAMEQKHSREPVSKKTNPLFDECVANVPEWIMKETSDKIDAMIAEEDLEKETARYEESIYGFESSSRDDCIGIAKHFAEYGARMQKEQMMKDAMECHVDYYDGPNLDFTQKQLDDALEKNGAKVGDKVKVIIVKDND